MQQLPQAPHVPTVSMPQGTGASAGDGGEKKMLNAFLEQLSKQEDLPQGVRDLMSRVTGTTVQEETKTLHKLVKQRSQASTTLAQLQKDRASFEASWATYSSSLVKLLQEQLQKRQETLEQMDKAQLEWTAQLRAVSAQIKEATSAGDPVHAVESSDSEEMEAVAENAEACAARQEEKRQQMTVQHAQILGALQQVQQSAMEGSGRREGSRTPRRKSEAAPDDKVGAKDKAAQQAEQKDGAKPPFC